MALYLLKPSEMATAWLFGGLPRSGKSYHAVAICERWLRSGGHVVTNMQLNVPSGFLARRRYRGRYMQLESGRAFVQEIQKFRAENDGHILLVLDEAASIFDSRDFKNFPADVRALLAQHAKMRISIITICHGYDMVDASFRKLAGYYVHHVSLGRSSGCFGLLAGLFFPGLMYRHTQALAGGELVGKRYEKKFLFGRQKVFDFYDTFQIAEGSFRGSDVLKKAVVTGFGWKRKVIFLGVLWALVRFTPFNSVPTVDVADDVERPFAVVSGEISGYDMQTGLVDLQTSSGEFFKVLPEASWGSVEPWELMGRFVSVDVWSTAPILRDYNMKERLREYAQKK